MSKKLTVEQVLDQHGLNFEIIKAPMSCTLPDGSVLLTPYYALVNTNTNEAINTVKAGYGVSQNADIVRVVLAGAEKFGNLTVQKAGSINGGRRVFVQLKIDGVNRVNNDDIVQYVTIIDSNDGSTGLSVGIGDLTMSCQNQFFFFYKAGEAKFRHTATIDMKIAKIPMLIEKALQESKNMMKLYEVLGSKSIDETVKENLMNHVLGHEDGATLAPKSANLKEGLLRHINKEINDKGQNLWGLHSGVTSWTTHDKKGPKREGGKEESMIVGTGYKKNLLSIQYVANEAGILLAA